MLDSHAHTDRIAEILEAHRGLEGPLLPILHAIQEAFGYVPDSAIPQIAKELTLSKAEVHGVISFYHDFRAKPAGRHVLKLCRAEACQAQGGRDLAADVTARLAGRADVAVEDVYCLGLCACGPAAMVDGELIGRADAATLCAKVTS